MFNEDDAYCLYTKDVPIFIEGKYKGKVFSQNWYVKREGFGSLLGASLFRTLWTKLCHKKLNEFRFNRNQI